MDEYELMTKRKLTGRTIKSAKVTGYGVVLKLDDGSVFEYSPSDDGYSCWIFRETEGASK